jgi:hypothetical protein
MTGMTGTVLVFAVLLGLIPAAIAQRKGGNFLAWWLFGAALWIVALPMALVKKDDRYGACPFWQEPVRLGASVCPHCQRDLAPVAAGP